jgi:hypothetical protein
MVEKVRVSKGTLKKMYRQTKKTGDPKLPVTLRALMQRIGRLKGYKVSKYYQRGATAQNHRFVINKDADGNAEVLSFPDLEKMARKLNVLMPFERLEY